MKQSVASRDLDASCFVNSMKQTVASRDRNTSCFVNSNKQTVTPRDLHTTCSFVTSIKQMICEKSLSSSSIFSAQEFLPPTLSLRRHGELRRIFIVPSDRFGEIRFDLRHLLVTQPTIAGLVLVRATTASVVGNRVRRIKNDALKALVFRRENLALTEMSWWQDSLQSSKLGGRTHFSGPELVTGLPSILQTWWQDSLPSKSLVAGLPSGPGA
ncbi:hypothetical protein PoB_006265800 [Plakobranchus ocellatus]|uniref:Uncharacterized protein n=1 Tax=Plakobranchus ocellatus TaxID=259542 RepID=A0AAV4CW81_9GAST|nr:hypothetical protein PoB_006265800 [Plakobranchus ocellatus]